MAHVFISYRREDSIAYAGRLHEILADRFGQAEVFMDIAALKPGEAFPEVLVNTVTACKALIAVIGRNWLTAAEDGLRRLDDPNDFVRIEVVTALTSGATVIPVLVGGAQMPPLTSLPVDLQPLALRHALVLPDIGFRESTRALMDVLDSENYRAPGGQDDDPTNATFDKKYLKEAQAAAAEGSPDAMATLGWLHFKAKDYAQARHWYNEAAASGNRDATAELAKVNEREELEKAAQIGNAEKMIELGHLCEVDGYFLNSEEARKWYEGAADLGHAGAMNELGELCVDERDYEQARRWYQKAADLGHPKAMSNLGGLYLSGHGVFMDKWRARQWYEKSVAVGSPDGIHNLGFLYQQGIGVEQNLRLADELFEKAERAGYGAPYGRRGRIEDEVKQRRARAADGSGGGKPSLLDPPPKAVSNTRTASAQIPVGIKGFACPKCRHLFTEDNPVYPKNGIVIPIGSGRLTCAKCRTTIVGSRLSNKLGFCLRYVIAGWIVGTILDILVDGSADATHMAAHVFGAICAVAGLAWGFAAESRSRQDIEQRLSLIASKEAGKNYTP